MANNQMRNIVAGPSREELFDALKYRHLGFKITVTVTPTLEVRQLPAHTRVQMKDFTFEAQVDGLGIEDGSGNSWLFKLYDPARTLGVERWSGYINTTRRTGTLTPMTI